MKSPCYSCTTNFDLQECSDISHSVPSHFSVTFCRRKVFVFFFFEHEQKIRDLAVSIYFFSQESIVLNFHLSLTIKCKKLIIGGLEGMSYNKNWQHWTVTLEEGEVKR